MRRLLTVLGIVLIVSATGVVSAAAGSPTSSRAADAPGRALGIVPVLDQARSARPTKTSNLTDHGGPVMQAGNATYAIFWDPAGSLDQTYRDTITGFFAHVAADSGKTSNVYFSDTQYSAIRYASTSVASVIDTAVYPANGCTDRATTICLIDAQLRTELVNVMSNHGWTASTSVNGAAYQNLFFIFTPKGVGSCSGSSCAYTNYCAYHWAISGTDPIRAAITGTEPILYANQPYGAQTYRLHTCDSGQRPNGTDADATINLVSHEHNEAITDELGSAWYDSNGYENGDKCAWNFGTAAGGSSGTLWNQAIGTGHYYLQQEWSNQRSGCVLQGT